MRAGRNNLLKNNNNESNPYIPLVDDYVLVTEFPELQDDSEDTYTPREHDPASIGNDDGGRLERQRMR